MGWLSHQLDHMQIICILLQTDNHTGKSSLNIVQAGCSSWSPPNRVKALEASQSTEKTIKNVVDLNEVNTHICLNNNFNGAHERATVMRATGLASVVKKDQWVIFSGLGRCIEFSLVPLYCWFGDRKGIRPVTASATIQFFFSETSLGRKSRITRMCAIA